jgi:hypothetical protein
MDDETLKAQEFVKEIRALAAKYEGHEHLHVYTDELHEVANDVEACIEDVEGVE